MSNLIASQKVMQHYLSALLTEDDTDAVVLAEEKKQQLNALLSQAVATAPAVKTAVKAAPADVPLADSVALETLKAKFAAAEQAQSLAQRDIPVAERIAPLAPADKAAIPVAAKTQLKDYRQGRFQALFFDVAGLKVAVPLKELGGIHQLGNVSSLIGKPEWFKGVMLYREQKINIVDTARWVMPEKYDQTLQQKLNYQYVIMLGNSNWGLCCETLINTYVLEQDEVKWREAEGKRPWMAGLIKQHMCVLIDVDAMIDLLNRGLDISA
jgi:purine-binding chemotaxis protein CheW